MTLIPPYDHPHVMAGQGTAALELIEEVGALDALLVCVGGGGLISGCAVAARHLLPGIAVYGVEPEAGNDTQLACSAARSCTSTRRSTIADGAQTQHQRPADLPGDPGAGDERADRQRRAAGRRRCASSPSA